jgi:ankyrin repeat protein
VKALFKEICAGHLAAVSARLEAHPQLVHAVAKTPPKKDDGQSPLQVAIKSGNFAVAHLLLDRGADVNYMDSSAMNPWNMPVVQDAIRAAVLSTRYGRNRALQDETPRVEVMSTDERFEEAFGVLDRLIRMGADVNALDSYGNDGLKRAVLDARSILDDKLLPLLPDLELDLRRIFALLIAAGADLERADPRFGQSVAQQVAGDTVGRFLRG